MTRQHTHTQAVEIDVIEREVTFAFTVAWGTPETGRGYMACPYSYDSGSPPVVEGVTVLQIDGKPGPFGWVSCEADLVQTLIDGADMGGMLASAEEDGADDRERAAEYRAEARRDDEMMGWAA